MHEGKESAQAVWGATPAGSAFAGAAPVGTKEFFENVLARRSTEEQPWLFELVPFASFKDRRVLEVGCGAGYDAYEICKHGARYFGIDITPENPPRTAKHLSFYGLEPRLSVADAETLPFRSATIEVVYSNGVLHHVPDLERSLREIHRVLRPDGELWLIVYHKTSVFYWLKLWLAQHVIMGGRKKCSMRERLARIESTTAGELPIVNVYTRRSLEKILRRCGFAPRATHVRKLTRDDLPVFGWEVTRFGLDALMDRAGKWWNALMLRIPQRWLDRLGKRFGWYLIVRARRLS